MIGLVRNEWKKVFLPVLLTTVLLAIAMGVVLHNLPKLCTALRFRGMGSWNRTVFSALSAVCCGAAMLEFVLRAQKQLPALCHAASEN